MAELMETYMEYLLERLEEGKAESGSETENSITEIEVVLPVFHGGDTRRCYVHLNSCHDHYGGSHKMPGTAAAILRVVQAVGRCKSVREVSLHGFLTSYELEAVLTPLQANSVLESISLNMSDDLYREPSIEVQQAVCAESVCVILGRILQTSRTLRSLYLGYIGLSASRADHLASALRGNSSSALERLSIRKWEEPSVVKHIAEIVLSAPKLSVLRLSRVGVLDDDGTRELSKALAGKTSLVTLRLDDVERGASALLLQTFTGQGSSMSITNLELRYIAGLGDCLPALLSSNHSLKSLLLMPSKKFSADMSPTQWRRVGQCLCSDCSLQVLRIEWLVGEAGIDGLRELLSAANRKEPIIDLRMSFLHELDDFDVDAIAGLASIENVVISNINSLQSLFLDFTKIPEGQVPQMENVFKALGTNSTVENLRITSAEGKCWSRAWEQLFVSLRHNITITRLALRYCGNLNEDAFKDLMGVLHVNSTLKFVDLAGTSWEKDGKAALIQEALRRNAEQEYYFSILRGAKLNFEGAQAGRLFLCGAPHAGKTQLRQTMTRIARGTSWLGDKAAQLLRTKGIEVDMLRDDEQMQIAIWDLAGQEIFRSLQDLLFPRANQACLFLFVFSVYDRESRHVKEDLEQSFKTELEDWLRFIASNLQITGRMRPRVVIVISHMDKMNVRSVGWAEIIIEELKAEYQDVLDICSSDELYQINAKKKKEVRPLKDFIFDSFGELLRTRSPIVPKICSEISSVLAKRTNNIILKHRPIWQSQDFYQFCFSKLKEDPDIKFLRLETHSGLEIFKAMASYLHDTGNIFMIPNTDWIIVDPNWLTNVFLGELITMGQNFQVSSDAVQVRNIAPYSSRNGFVSYGVLHQLLSSFVRKHIGVRELNERFLEELLIQLELCYKIDDGPINSRYYIPTIVCEDASLKGVDKGRRRGVGMEVLSWGSSEEIDDEFIGFRVECKNPRRMCMTSAFFPRYQIYMRHKLMTEMNLIDDDVICSRNYMRLRMDGHEIFVERSDMAKSHVDIMVKCSKLKSRAAAMKYVKGHIIDGLRIFCASPKGCPGIALVVGILQTQCVEKLVPSEYRGEKQAVLVEKLKKILEDYIMEHVKGMKLESWTENATLLNYEYSWPAVPGYMLSTFEPAKNLLSEVEVESVTKKVLEKHEQQLRLLDQISEQMSDEMDHILCVSDDDVEVGTSRSTQELGDPCSSTKDTLNPSYAGEPTVKDVLSRIASMNHRMVEGFHVLEGTLRRIEEDMDNIVDLQHKLQSTMSTFMSKVDRMIGYAESWEGSRTPKRPYFSFDNVNIFQKFTALMCLGTPVKLHLMCESMTGPHIIKDQPGLNLCVEKENMAWLRCIYDISLKMMYYLVKAGLHVTLGLGQAVPDLECFEAALPLSIASTIVDNINIDDRMMSSEMSGNITSHEAWNHLRSVLAPTLENNYTVLFKLYRVKYLKQEKRGYAWVCQQCMARGDRNGSLECL